MTDALRKQQHHIWLTPLDFLGLRKSFRPSLPFSTTVASSLQCRPPQCHPFSCTHTQFSHLGAIQHLQFPWNTCLWTAEVPNKNPRRHRENMKTLWCILNCKLIVQSDSAHYSFIKHQQQWITHCTNIWCINENENPNNWSSNWRILRSALTWWFLTCDHCCYQCSWWSPTDLCCPGKQVMRPLQQTTIHSKIIHTQKATASERDIPLFIWAEHVSPEPLWVKTPEHPKLWKKQPEMRWKARLLTMTKVKLAQ